MVFLLINYSYVCKNSRLEISCIWSLSLRCSISQKKTAKSPDLLGTQAGAGSVCSLFPWHLFCAAPFSQPQIILAVSSFKFSSKDLPYFFWKSSPVYLCSGSFSLPEQTSSTEHPAALRKAGILPSGPAQWLLLQSLGFAPLLWQPSLCVSAARTHGRTHSLGQCPHLWSGDCRGQLSVML